MYICYGILWFHALEFLHFPVCMHRPSLYSQLVLHPYIVAVTMKLKMNIATTSIGIYTHSRVQCGVCMRWYS